MTAYKLRFAVQPLELDEITQLALTTHPDKNPDNEEATQQFQQISEAYHLLVTHFDKSDQRHEYAGPFDEYDDGDDDYDGDGGIYVFLDPRDLEFYLWVVFHPLFETYLQSSCRFMFEEVFGGGPGPFGMGNSNAPIMAHPHKLTYRP